MNFACSWGYFKAILIDYPSTNTDFPPRSAKGNEMGEPTGLFDLQVNGYAGVDFNEDHLTNEQIAYACQRLQQDGVSGFLATLITANIESMIRRLAAIVRCIHECPAVAGVIHGIHLEGPFISDEPGYVGAHPREAVRPASVDLMRPLIDAGQGMVKLVTLAPERDPKSATTRWLVDQGVVISAGHCNPTADEFQGAIDQGLSMFTHLGNGCPLQLDRHDNVIQRVLSMSTQLWISFIADGVHIPFHALRNYLKVTGCERAIIVSDAISAAGLGPGRYSLAGQPVAVDEALATWSADGQHLMGSACPMKVSFQNLITHVGLTHGEASRLTRENPRSALGLN